MDIQTVERCVNIYSAFVELAWAHQEIEKKAPKDSKTTKLRDIFFATNETFVEMKNAIAKIITILDLKEITSRIGSSDLPDSKAGETVSNLCKKMINNLPKIEQFGDEIASATSKIKAAPQLKNPSFQELRTSHTFLLDGAWRCIKQLANGMHFLPPLALEGYLTSLESYYTFILNDSDRMLSGS